MFITLEGPEGGGKTSHMLPLSSFLSQQGYEVMTTREPGGTDIGDQVRAVLTRLENTRMHPRTETLLFLAARAQLVEERIRPQLSQGCFVISDRYADSTLAYQGYGHGNDLDLLRHLLNFATGNLWPDLTILLNIPPDEGLKRKRSGGEWNRLDAYTLAFHERVWHGYQELARQDANRWVVVDASQPFDDVQTQIRQAVIQKISKQAVSPPVRPE